MIEIAWTALALWPVVCIILYRTLSLPVALIISLLGAFLVLPAGLILNLPGMPPLHKGSISVFCAAFLTVAAIRSDRESCPVLSGWVPRTFVPRILLAILVVGIFGTVLTNSDPLSYGPRVLPGLRLYDAFSVLLISLISIVAPLLLARKVLASSAAQRVLLTIFVISAVIYTIPALWEVRMSPQIHLQLYGYHPHAFNQQMRGGGFRPVVFIGHGLGVAFFFTLAFVGALGLYRGTLANSSPHRWLIVAGWIFGTLVLSKSLGPLMIALLIAPVALFLRPRLQLIAGACISIVVVTYPMLRSADVIPLDRFVSFTQSIDEQRSESFVFRLRHEEALLEKARERPLFGWGSWGRNRIYADDGRDLSVVDGGWINRLGTGGWFLYIPIFGLLAWPGIALLLGRRDKTDPVCIALVLIVSANLINLIPNNGLPAYVWLMVGSLIGRLEKRETSENAMASDPSGGKPDRRPGIGGRDLSSGYARQFPDKADNTATPPAGAKKQRPKLSRFAHKYHKVITDSGGSR